MCFSKQMPLSLDAIAHSTFDKYFVFRCFSDERLNCCFTILISRRFANISGTRVLIILIQFHINTVSIVAAGVCVSVCVYIDMYTGGTRAICMIKGKCAEREKSNGFCKLKKRAKKIENS